MFAWEGAHLLRKILLAFGLTTAFAFAGDTPPAPASPVIEAAKRRPLALDDLFSDLNVVDTAISTSGRYLAVILRKGENDLLVVFDLQTNEKKVIERTALRQFGKNINMHLVTVYWKSDDRLLFRLRVLPEDGKLYSISDSKIGRLGDRLFAINRDGTNAVPLLGDNRNVALEGAFDLGNIASFLTRDPTHILMELDGWNGRSLFKVDLESGKGEQLERPQDNVVGWWLDLDGNPVVRTTASSGTVRMFRKVDGKWVQFLKMRAREMREKPDYESVGPSDQDGKYYVLARPPGHDRKGLYLYDLEKEQFGDPIVENAQYDIDSADASRDGKQVLYHCYLANVRVCEFTDQKLDAHMRGLRKYFDENANVYVYDVSQDGKSFLLFVEGPRDPPAYYYYLTESKSIQTVGSSRGKLDDVLVPGVKVVSYKARDGKDLTGYLTTPANLSPGTKAPLVLYPHGGPEARDHLTFDPWVQYFVARGYAVFQPNFRGSDGFGKAFAESGYGEWGRKMQDDLSDAVKTLVDAGTADPARVCIVGASYGGYAALAGAALTPELYKCAVSVAGISDLDDFITWRKHNWGRDSEGYTYWLKAIGDPDKDEQKLRAVSPVSLVDKIKVPILLIHGTDDGIVPIAQSRAMKKALDKSGRKTELIEIEKEGHSYWSDENEKLALASIDQFLWKNLGAGVGITTPPAPRGDPKK
jgi:dipeptidyl aminopeptidase/acylaminoacyl peptidase